MLEIVLVRDYTRSTRGIQSYQKILTIKKAKLNNPTLITYSQILVIKS